MTQPVFVVSEWLAKPGKDQELWQCFETLLDISLKEKGCITARATRQIAHPGAPGTSKFNIVLMQEYIDIQAFDFHCQQAHVKDFFKTHIEDLVEDWTCRLFREEP